MLRGIATPHKALHAQAQRGKRIATRGINLFFPGRARAALVQVQRDLTVNVGSSRFADCVRLDLTEHEDGTVWSATFAPGVGLVLVTSSDGEWYELETADIAGKHVAT